MADPKNLEAAADVATSTLTISLIPTPGGLLRTIEAKGTSYGLEVWSHVLRELADELDEAAAAAEDDDEDVDGTHG